MMKDRQIAAMHRELDGVNSPEETAELKTLLGSDPEARTYFENLNKLGEMLSAVPEVDPPRELKAGVMKAVRKATEPATTPVITPVADPGLYDGFLNNFLGAFRGRWAYALTFSAGIAAGILGFTAFGDSVSPGNEGLTGTMAPTHDFVTVGKQDFNQAGVVGSVETQYAADHLVATIDVASPEDLDIVFEFDGKVLNPLGFHQSSPHPMGITAEPGQFKVRHRGENSYVFTLGYPARTASEVHVKFYSEGLLFQKTLKTLPDNE
jgi:hypothetical protein